jgi:asparaginyl-tRNA synthetase
MGKGSDSLPIPMQLGKDQVFLTDSAQFGMEPLVQNAFRMVYCYLPSFRGENPDMRHLNQFYHCEAELCGQLDETITIVENLIHHLMSNILTKNNGSNYVIPSEQIQTIEYVSQTTFPTITFDEACKLLQTNGLQSEIERHDFGKTISREGEVKVVELVSNNKLPVWIREYDRDTVPFYQKPVPTNKSKVLNADLIFPKIGEAFGGEIVGCGQRQDNIDEILESMQRQGVYNYGQYDWYLELRKRSDYKITSGFGLGIERLLAWILRESSIIDTAIYPVLKDIATPY